MSRAAFTVLLTLALVVWAPHGHARGAGGHGGGGGYGGGGRGGGGGIMMHGGTMMHQSGAGEFHGGQSGWHGGYGQGHGWYGHGWHGHGWNGWGSSFFVGGYFYDPFLFPFYAPYPYAYPYPYSYYPADDTYDDGAPPPEAARPEEAPPEADTSSYGLLQLRGVPNGAAVYLDGRFWLQARDLDERWLALPAGRHTIAVEVQGRNRVERDIGIRAGQQVVVPLPRPS